MLDRAAQAMVDMLGAMREAKASGASPEQLARLDELQKKAMWRLDYISSENSMGFHADQEAVQVLGESIDFSRQAQALAVRLRAPAAPQVAPPADSRILGVTPTDKAPPAP
jgi:nitrite reductase (cytochrome c-552)